MKFWILQGLESGVVARRFPGSLSDSAPAGALLAPLM